MGEEQMKYKAHIIPFELRKSGDDLRNSILRSVDIPSIDYAESGFWIDKNYEFRYITEIGAEENCKYWIPPSQVKYVEKITVE